MVDRARWQRLKDVLQDALDQPEAERHELIRRACGDDRALAAEAIQLLDGQEAADEFFSREEPDDQLLGTCVGAYRLGSVIGHGGMGTVYRAEREDDAFQRAAAVKVLNGGFASQDVVSRFRTERQILASVDHPNIAKLFDGGETRDGRPYLVMELVEGLPIDAYCETHELTVTDRLRLFVKVCRAVQVAHQSLVVHRDLKPANILVTEEGEPKLLDFGIAKLLATGDRVEVPGVTHESTRVMTPEYASPEQALGAPVTTATDVYALGVVLYVLLAGRLPFDVEGLDLLELARVVRERAPERPSSAAPAQVRRQIRGDLDWIVLKALRKEPERRYPSALALAEDIERHLDHLPVLARPDSMIYRASRFARRHVVGIAAACLVTAGFVTFLGFTLNARHRAEVEAAKANAVNQFLQSVLRAPNTARGGMADVSVSDALEAASESVHDSFRDQPELEAAVRHTIGMTLVSLGRYEAGGFELDSALALRRELLGERHPDVAQSLYGMGVLHFQKGDMKLAEASLDRASELQRSLLGDDHPDLARSLHVLGAVHENQNDFTNARSLFMEALSIRRRALGDDDPLTASVLTDLGILAQKTGDVSAASEFHRKAVGILRRIDHPRFAVSVDFYARFLFEQGELARAAELYEEAEASFRARHDRFPLSQNLRFQAELQALEGNAAQAERLFEESLEILRELVGDEHPDVGNLRFALARFLAEAGRSEQALEHLGQARELFESHYGTEHALTQKALSLEAELSDQ